MSEPCDVIRVDEDDNGKSRPNLTAKVLKILKYGTMLFPN